MKKLDGYEEKDERLGRLDEGVSKSNRVDLAAKIIFALGIACSVIYALFLMKEGNNALAGMMLLVVGPFFSWLGYEFLSGFAMLLKKVSLIEQQIRKK